MNLKNKRIKKTAMSIQYAISTDNHNLLQDNDNIIIYTFKKLYYKLMLSIKNREIIKWYFTYF